YVPRYLNPTGVHSAAGYGDPSPGSLITVYGANLGSDELSQATQFPLPPALNGLMLLVNGQPVPLLATTPPQINAQLPQTVPSRPDRRRSNSGSRAHRQSSRARARRFRRYRRRTTSIRSQKAILDTRRPLRSMPEPEFRPTWIIRRRREKRSRSTARGSG